MKRRTDSEGFQCRRPDKEVRKPRFEPPRVLEVVKIEARAGVCQSPPTFGKTYSQCLNLFS